MRNGHDVVHRGHHGATRRRWARGVPRVPKDIRTGPDHLAHGAHLEMIAQGRHGREHQFDGFHVALVLHVEREPQSGTQGNQAGQQGTHIASNAPHLAQKTSGLYRYHERCSHLLHAGGGQRQHGIDQLLFHTGICGAETSRARRRRRSIPHKILCTLRSERPRPLQPRSFAPCALSPSELSSPQPAPAADRECPPSQLVSHPLEPARWHDTQFDESRSSAVR